MKNVKKVIEKYGFNKLGYLNAQVSTKKFWEDHNLLSEYEYIKSLGDVFSENLYLYLGNEHKMCEYCGINKTKFKSFKKGYRKYCSKKCATKATAKNENRLNKIKQTKLERYGDENYNNSKKNIETSRKNDSYRTRQIKIKETNLKKYGVESTNQLESVKEKKKITNIIKYGVENPMQSKIVQQKSKETKIKRYGKDYGKIIIRKGTKTKIKKYGKDYAKIFNKKMMNNLMKGYEQDHINQLHIKNYKELKNLDKNKIQKWIKNNRFLVDEFLEYFNVSKYYINKVKKKNGIDIPNKIKKTKTQQEIFDFIPNENKKFNDREILNPLEIDILSDKYKFGIEFDGIMFHSFGVSNCNMFNNTNEDRYIHLRKTEALEDKGYQLFHIFENEWIDPIKRDIWKSIILSKMSKTKRIFARKCTIKEVQPKEAKEFLEENHLQGYVPAKLKIGLYYNDELLQICTFSKPRMTKKYSWELLRMCNKKFYTVIGGFSKILKYFEREYKPKSLISYANRRWSKGNVYQKTEFKLNNVSKPNYFYFLKKEYILYSRNKFQKHKLKNLLKDFNQDLTETENMYNNGYRKIYDCGNLVFVKEYK